MPFKAALAEGVKGTPETKGLVTSVGTTIGGLKTPGGVVGKTSGGGGGVTSGGGGGGGVGSGGVKIGPSNGPSKGTSRAACAKADGIINVAQKVIVAVVRNQLTCCLTERRPLTMVQNPYNLCFGHVSTRFCWVNYSKLEIVFCSV